MTVVLSDTTLVITLHGALSPLERALAKTPDGAAQVQEFHRQLFANAADSRKELCLGRLRRALDCNLGELTEVEATVLAHRFFTEERRSERTFQEIGVLIGLSKERVRQIQNIALEKLREVLEFDPVLK